MTQNLEEVKEQARKAAAELLEAARLLPCYWNVSGTSTTSASRP